MSKLTIVFVIVIVLAVIGGGIFLASWNPSPPTATVEKVIPNARFPK